MDLVGELKQIKCNRCKVATVYPERGREATCHVCHALLKESVATVGGGSNSQDTGLRAENARLREALTSIDYDCIELEMARFIARQALEQKS